jgi:hypothetical protein
MSSAGLGVWDRPGFPETFDFATANDLSVTRTDDAGDEHTTHFTYVYTRAEMKLVTKAKASGVEKVYTVKAHTETRLELDDGSGVLLALIPSGYDGGIADEEQDGNDSGVDLGMELCVVGKKIGK